VSGDLHSARVEGLVVRRWNEWIDRESSGEGVVDLFGYHVGPIEHPCLVVEGRDYTVFNDRRELDSQVARRAAVLSELQDLALDHALKIDPGSVLTPLQLTIVQALERVQPQDADELAVSCGCGRRTLYNPGGIKELLVRGIVVKGHKSAGYYLARTSHDE
jgi:hypothetical protein